MKAYLPLSVAALSACLASGLACGGGRLGDPTGTGGAAGIALTGTGGGAVGGGSIGGGAAGAVVPPDPCTGASDARLVLAPQRKFLLTVREVVNMVRAVAGDNEAAALLSSGILPIANDVDRQFPPATGDTWLTADYERARQLWDGIAQHVAQYVHDNFAVVTGCASPATDACAKAYLGSFAAKAYRRPLDTGEEADLDARYDSARSGGADGGEPSPEMATRDTISAIMVAPPFLYRSELGDATQPSVSPAGVPLTPSELASALSFFLTDGPPDQPLLDDARAGTLTDTLGAHVDRLLATLAARAWLTTIIETYFQLNQLPTEYSIIDGRKFPEVNPTLLADMQTEARKFIDFTLWGSSPMTDLLTSRTTFVNSNLATNLYKIPLPAGATATSFVQISMPADQRSGLLTNAAFLTTVANSERGNVGMRGMAVAGRMLGRRFDYHPFEAGDLVGAALAMRTTQTAQEQAAYRASLPACRDCHAGFDPYGVALDNYDNIGRYRTIDDLGLPVDAHATLPPELGGGIVSNAIELGRAIAASPRFTNMMAWVMLRYAMVDYSAYVELSDASDGTPGCAVADVVTRFQNNRARTFSNLVREVVLSPAFSLRRPAQ